ncbi:hypothetical protein ABW20_dc0109640 [Dactylellina cionopaga]|nr:hypothetical protein ABW20_dc0109640 [Dactylellina cionopaga]
MEQEASNSKRPGLFARLKSKSRSKSPAPPSTKNSSGAAIPYSPPKSTVTVSDPISPDVFPKPQLNIPIIKEVPASICESLPDKPECDSNLTPNTEYLILSVKTEPAELTIWEQATLKLSEEERSQLSIVGNKLEIIQNVLKSTEEAKLLAQKRAWKVTWRGETLIVRDIAEKIQFWVKKFVEIGDAAVQYDPGHAAIPWAAVRFLLQTAIHDVENREGILIGIESVSRIISRCAAYEIFYLPANLASNTSNQDILKDGLMRLYSDILRFLLKARNHLEKKSHGSRTIDSILQASFHDEMLGAINDAEGDILKTVSIMDTEIQQSFNEEQRSSMSKLHDIFSSFEQPIARMDNNIAGISDHFDASTRSSVLEWLSKANYHSFHESVQRTIAEGTCKWLHQDQKFLEWRKSSSHSIFWLRGDPGCGKTRLTSSVIDLYFRDRKTNNSQEGIAFFYIDRTGTGGVSASPQSILNALVKQLATLHPDAPILSPVTELFSIRQKQGRISHEPSYDEACQLIIHLTNMYPQSIIVIDALDEMDDKDNQWQLVDFFIRLKESSNSLVKIFFSSRTNEDKLNILLESQVCKHYITLRDNEGDIERFINISLDNIIQSRRLLAGKVPNKTRELIFRSLKERAGGMFLWVSLQLQSLTSLRSSAQAEKALNSTPTKLSELYKEVYESIFIGDDELDRNIAQTALLWVLGAVRPLTSAEMTGLIRWKVDAEDLGIEDILAACRNILACDPESLEIRLLHLTTKDFLLLQPGMDLKTAQKTVSVDCLQILNTAKELPAAVPYSIGCGYPTALREKKMPIYREALEEGQTDGILPEIKVLSYSHLFYAWRYWIMQIRVTGDEEDDIFRELFQLMGSLSKPESKFLDIAEAYCYGAWDFYVSNIWLPKKYFVRELVSWGLQKHGKLCTPFDIAIAGPFPRYIQWIWQNDVPTLEAILERKGFLEQSAKSPRSNCFEPLLDRLFKEAGLAKVEPLAYGIVNGLCMNDFVDGFRYFFDSLEAAGCENVPHLLGYSLSRTINVRRSEEMFQEILRRKPDLKGDNNPLNETYTLIPITPYSLKILRLLTEHGADINGTYSFGLHGQRCTVLQYLQYLYTGHWDHWPKVIEAFSRLGADMNGTGVVPGIGEQYDKSCFYTSMEIPMIQYLHFKARIFSVKEAYYGKPYTMDQLVEIIRAFYKAGAKITDAIIMRAWEIHLVDGPDALDEIRKIRPDTQQVIENTMKRCLDAIEAGNLDLVKHLMQQKGIGLEVSLSDFSGSPLGRAMSAKSIDNNKMVTHILSLNAQTIKPGNEPELLNIGIETQNIKVVKFLAKAGLKTTLETDQIERKLAGYIREAQGDIIDQGNDENDGSKDDNAIFLITEEGKKYLLLESKE